jgi:hypothetical protein
MANEFTKEEKVAFDELLMGFDDALVLSKLVSKYNIGSVTAERTNDTIWRPQPYILESYDGMDQTANFKDKIQCSVPATIGYKKSVPWIMDALELRDALQEHRLGEGAKQKIASDINIAVNNVAALQGTLVVTQTTAAAGFVDVAKVDTLMNEQGVIGYERYLALSSLDYNGMAQNLANRETMGSKVTTAYEQAYVGNIAGISTFKMDYSNRMHVAAGTVTINTTDAGLQFYSPEATSTAATGEVSNVDNRYQQVTVSSTTSVVAGDAFTIAAVNAVHHITKSDTGRLKTFRVISVDSATTMTISPPIISNQVVSNSGTQYKNCVVNTKSATSALVFLNTVAANINPFWQKGAIEILPAKYEIPKNAGMAVMSAKTANGLTVTMAKQVDINTLKIKYRIDCYFGVVNLAPEMSGILLFSQSAAT